MRSCRLPRPAGDRDARTAGKDLRDVVELQSWAKESLLPLLAQGRDHGHRAHSGPLQLKPLRFCVVFSLAQSDAALEPEPGLNPNPPILSVFELL